MNPHEIVVITGGSAGIGRATAHAFAKKGASVAIMARGQKGLQSTKEEIEKAGGRALVVQADVADADAVEKAAQTIEDELGPIDIWINSAMTTVFAQFVDITPEEFRRVTEVTYLGFVYGTYSALTRMVKRNRGTIIQVGSALAYRSIPLQSAYCGAKHAIQGFTDSIRSELLHNKSDVWISMVQLPAVNTPQFNWCRNKMPRKSQPVPPIFQPELIAEYIYWAAHKRRRETVLGLNNWIIVWGNKFFPGFGDWYLAKTGFDSQQYNGSPGEDRPDNLWAPVDTNPGTQGSFTENAISKSNQMKFTTFPGYPFYGGIAVGGMLLSLLGWALKKKKAIQS